MIEKERVLDALRACVEADLEALAGSQRSAQSGATHEDARAEADTDMRSTESSYLARGLSERVAALSQEAATLRSMRARPVEEDERIAVGALVSLRSDQGLSHYFLVPVAGGVRMAFGDTEIVSVTPSAPLARALIGQRCGDEIELSSPRGRQSYEIVGVC